MVLSNDKGGKIDWKKASFGDKNNEQTHKRRKEIEAKKKLNEEKIYSFVAGQAVGFSRW